MKKITNSLIVSYFVLCVLIHPTVFSKPEPWFPFQWGGPKEICGVTYNQIAVAFPVTINGEVCTVQLDTGLEEMFRPDRDLPKEGKKVPVSIKVGSVTKTITLPHAALGHLHEHSIAHDKVGSLGNAFFDTGTLFLDLKRGLFRFDEAAFLQDDKESQPMVYSAKPGKESGLIYIEVTLPKGKPAYMNLDMGSAMFSFITSDQGLWDTLKDPQQPEHSYYAQGLTRLLRNYTQEGLNIKIGNTWFKNGRLLFVRSIMDQTTGRGSKVGLRSFIEGTLIIDYISKKWRYIPG